MMAVVGVVLYCPCGQALQREGVILRCLNKGCPHYNKLYTAPMFELEEVADDKSWSGCCC